MSLPALPPAVLAALEALERAGFSAYVVGGCVRDGLRGIAPHDWDVCTAATPPEVHAALAGAFSVQDTGLRHGTVTAARGALRIEITTYRVESGYADGRHPDEVAFVSDVTRDLARRDFTVCAMAYSPARGLCDPFGGQRDLAAGLLRGVGDPDARLAEDALRILRGLRLASEHGFSVEPATAQAIRRQMHRLDAIAPERICEELTRLLCGRYVGRVLRAQHDVLGQVLPELVPMFGAAQQNAHHKYDVWEHTVRAVEQVPSTPLLRFAALLHDSGKPACKTVDARGVGHFYGHPAQSEKIAAQIAARLRFSGALQSALLPLVLQHDKPLGGTAPQLRHRLAQLGEAQIRSLLALKKGDAVGQETHPEDIAALCETERLLGEILAAQDCISRRQLAVDGRDLMSLGLRGAAIGDMLAALLAHVLECPQDNEKQTLLALARGIQKEGAHHG